MGGIVSRSRSLFAKAPGRIALVFGVLLVLTVAVPLEALGATGETERSSRADMQPGEMPADFHPGNWTEVEPWAAQLESLAGGSQEHLSSATLPPVLWYDDMESGEGGWTKTGTWALTEEWGGTNHSPTHAWSDSPGGDYPINSRASIISPTLDLSSVQVAGNHAKVIFNVKVDTEYPYWTGSGTLVPDCMHVMYSRDGGINWDSRGIYFGDGEGYVVLDVPDSFLTNKFKLRFYFESDYLYQYDGVYVDDVAVLTTPDEVAQESDSRLTRLGDWIVATGPYGSAYTYSYADMRGSAVVVNFSGTGLEWYGTVGPNYGIANVSLDGAPPLQVDLYNRTAVYYYPSSVPQQPILATWDIWGVLADGPHTMVIWSSDEKNPASWGYRVSVDHLDVWGTFTQSPSVERSEQDDANLESKGPWVTTPDSGASGGSLAVVNAPGSSLNVAFEGTYLAWLAKKGPGYGKAWVSLDGGPLETVDLYHPWNSSRKRAYHIGPLADEPHTLSIYWSGEKNASAWGTVIDADSFEVLGALTDADPAEPITWRCQQTDPRITYLGKWDERQYLVGFGRQLRLYRAARSGAHRRVHRHRGQRCSPAPPPGTAKAEIYVDDTLEDTVDLYSATTVWKAPIWSCDTLSAGEHTLVIKCTGEKNLSSGGTSIALDALDILGYLEQAPQDHPRGRQRLKLRHLRPGLV